GGGRANRGAGGRRGGHVVRGCGRCYADRRACPSGGGNHPRGRCGRWFAAGTGRGHPPFARLVSGPGRKALCTVCPTAVADFGLGHPVRFQDVPCRRWSTSVRLAQGNRLLIRPGTPCSGPAVWPPCGRGTDPLAGGAGRTPSSAPRITADPHRALAAAASLGAVGKGTTSNPSDRNREYDGEG